jgi:hypothetical protein
MGWATWQDICPDPRARTQSSMMNSKTVSAIHAETERDREQLDLLRLPLGDPGSGMHRYGAAMYFHKCGKLDAEQLEAYRICCNLDFEDPERVIRSRKDPDA